MHFFFLTSQFHTEESQILREESGFAKGTGQSLPLRASGFPTLKSLEGGEGGERLQNANKAFSFWSAFLRVGGEVVPWPSHKVIWSTNAYSTPRAEVDRAGGSREHRRRADKSRTQTNCLDRLRLTPRVSNANTDCQVSGKEIRSDPGRLGGAK